MNKAEAERARTKPPNSWQAYDYYLQGAEALAAFASSMRAEDIYKARHLLEHSLAVDANYARSYAVLAQTHAAVFVMRVAKQRLVERSACFNRFSQLVRRDALSAIAYPHPVHEHQIECRIRQV